MLKKTDLGKKTFEQAIAAANEITDPELQSHTFIGIAATMGECGLRLNRLGYVEARGEVDAEGRPRPAPNAIKEASRTDSLEVAEVVAMLFGRAASSGRATSVRRRPASTSPRIEVMTRRLTGIVVAACLAAVGCGGKAPAPPPSIPEPTAVATSSLTPRTATPEATGAGMILPLAIDRRGGLGTAGSDGNKPVRPDRGGGSAGRSGRSPGRLRSASRSAARLSRPTARPSPSSDRRSSSSSRRPTARPCPYPPAEKLTELSCVATRPTGRKAVGQAKLSCAGPHLRLGSPRRGRTRRAGRSPEARRFARLGRAGTRPAAERRQRLAGAAMGPRPRKP